MGLAGGLKQPPEWFDWAGLPLVGLQRGRLRVPGSTSKKVIVLRFDREMVAGYLAPGAFRAEDGCEILSPDGAVSILPPADLKAICFVKDWDQPAGWRERRSFGSRPKMEGLWVKLVFRDADWLEALIPNRIPELLDSGLMCTPPDTGNTQRLFVPRTALSAGEVLGVIGSARRARKEKERPPGQLPMFE
jgi:hypothetical protein